MLCSSYARASNYTQRDFTFAAIQVTDDNGYSNTASQNHPFGVITLEIWRIEVISVATQPSIHILNQKLDSQTIHESSGNAGTHHARYGEEYYSPAPIVDIVSGRRIGDNPYVTFTFNYRPLDILMANKIVPRPQDLKIILDPATEIRQLEARISALRAKGSSSRVRSDPYPAGASGRNVKGHGKTRVPRSKTTNTLEGTIDLTG